MKIIIGKKYELVLALLFSLVLIGFGYYELIRIKKENIERTKVTISTINTSCHEALKQWLSFRKENIAKISKNETLINITLSLLNLERDKETLLRTPYKKELRNFFIPILAANEDIGVFIIAPDYTSLFSMRDTNTGTKNLMAVHKKELLDEVLNQGRIVLVPPIPSDVPLLNNQGKLKNQSHTMFLLAPIIYDNKIIAAFSLRMNIHKDFSRILELGRIGLTGETFAFDKNGNVVTTSRFEEQLQKQGVLPPGKESITQIKTTTPAPLSDNDSLFDQSALFPELDTQSVGEFIDNRNVDVIGLKVWDNELNIGIVTKIDKKEARSFYLIIRKIITVFICCTLIVTLILLYIIINLRQKNEQILLQTNEKLEKTVRIRTKELRKAIATKDKFFSILAHDLKNPFNGILGLFEVLLDNPEAIPNKKKNELIRMVYDSGIQLYRLLENLLSWSRGQSHNIIVDPEIFSLRGLISENIYLQKNHANHKKILLENDVLREIIVYADKNTINTVFRNLISNAIKFTMPGGKISISAKEKAHTIDIIVEDDGVGISEENLKKVFRLDEKLTTFGTNKEQGSGLGLILCKDFVELNKGTISVESTIGKGSKFTVTLPKEI
jgi:signal transduction histidine kinase